MVDLKNIKGFWGNKYGNVLIRVKYPINRSLSYNVYNKEGNLILSGNMEEILNSGLYYKFLDMGGNSIDIYRVVFIEDSVTFEQGQILNKILDRLPFTGEYIRDVYMIMNEDKSFCSFNEDIYICTMEE